MPETEAKRKRRTPRNWLWGIVALLLVIFLSLWLLPGREAAEIAELPPIDSAAPATPTEPAATTPAPTTEPADTTAPAARDGPAPAPQAALGLILKNPGYYVGSAFPPAPVRVVDVATERGFFVEESGNRLLVVLADGPRDDIRPGARIQVRSGTLRDPATLADGDGAALDDRTRALAVEQPIVLVVNGGDLELPEPGEGG